MRRRPCVRWSYPLRQPEIEGCVVVADPEDLDAVEVDLLVPLGPVPTFAAPPEAA